MLGRACPERGSARELVPNEVRNPEDLRTQEPEEPSEIQTRYGIGCRYAAAYLPVTKCSNCRSMSVSSELAP